MRKRRAGVAATVGVSITLADGMQPCKSRVSGAVPNAGAVLTASPIILLFSLIGGSTMPLWLLRYSSTSSTSRSSYFTEVTVAQRRILSATMPLSCSYCMNMYSPAVG